MIVKPTDDLRTWPMFHAWLIFATSALLCSDVVSAMGGGGGGGGIPGSVLRLVVSILGILVRVLVSTVSAVFSVFSVFSVVAGGGIITCTCGAGG